MAQTVSHRILVPIDRKLMSYKIRAHPVKASHVPLIRWPTSSDIVSLGRCLCLLFTLYDYGDIIQRVRGNHELMSTVARHAHGDGTQACICLDRYEINGSTVHNLMKQV